MVDPKPGPASSEDTVSSQVVRYLVETISARRLRPGDALDSQPVALPLLVDDKLYLALNGHRTIGWRVYGDYNIDIYTLKNEALDQYSGFVEDSGEGRWTINAAIDEAVPAEVLTAALFARFRSRKDHTFAEKILSAMRAGFGGHKEPQGNH